MRTTRPAGDVDGGPRAEYDALLWQARAQVDLGALIEQYLTDHPPPVLADHAGLYRRWAQELVTAGEVQLEELEESELRAA